MNKKLSKEAYGGVEGSKYVPYISDQVKAQELTPLVLIIGLVLAVLFAASNSYAAMTAGMTVAAGIPGAILGGGILTLITRKGSALSTNIMQGMSSGGESIASGMTFVLPAVFLIGQDVSFFTGFIVGLAGTLFGIGVTSIVHNHLIVAEHGHIVYPEAMAISETVVSTDAGGEGLKIMGIGALVGSIATIISSQITGLVATTVSFTGDKFKYQWQTDANPLLLGIGFIVGLEVGIAMLAGSILANFAVIPLLGYFAANADPAAVAWNNPDLHLVDMTAANIQSTYTKYIGAGMMLAGGVISAIKLLPVIISSVKEILGAKQDNQNSGITGLLIIGGIAILAVSTIFITSSILMGIVTIILVLIFSFLFSIVAARMTGDIGTSNLPVSGMTIASLLIVTVVFVFIGKATGVAGWTDANGNLAILLALTAVVTAISVSAGYSQTQKATFILGGSKNKMQLYYTISSIVGVATSVAVIKLLQEQIVNGSELVQIPQATLMASITEGILQNSLPGEIIFVGIFMAIVLFLLDLPIMTVAIGFYLPLGTVSIVFFGGLIRYLVDRKNKDNKEVLDKKVERGTIFSSGLIAGGALCGLVGAFLAVIAGENGMQMYPFYFGTSEGELFSGNLIAFVLVVALCLITYFFINKKQD